MKRCLISVFIGVLVLASVSFLACERGGAPSPAQQDGPSPLIARFTAEPTAGEAPLTVQFGDCSTGDITTWTWDFGDGQGASSQNPNHTYASAGDYKVSLVVESPWGTHSETKVDYIRVTAPEIITPDPITPEVTSPDAIIQETVTTPAEDIEPEPPPEQGIISWEHAGDYIGEYKTVEGTIVTTYYAETSGGQPSFLDFHDPYQGYFKCLIWGNDRPEFINQFPPDPETYFLGKRVRVTGEIESYKGDPEIILRSPSQIEVIE